jgi:hypothetical protein
LIRKQVERRLIAVSGPGSHLRRPLVRLKEKV